MTQEKSVCSRIRNARTSLDNAERSFRSHQDIRGELDLMLAEAELENLRQKRDGRFVWTRHTLALCFAVLVLAAGGLGWWWASAYGGNTTNAAGLQSPLMVRETEKPATKADKAQRETVKKQEIQPAAVKREASVIHKETVPGLSGTPQPQGTKTEREGVRLSADQMRRLIRSGKQELGNIR